MGPGFLIDTNVIIGFFDTTLPEAGRNFVAGLIPAISVITQIELFSSAKTPAAEIEKLRAFVQAAHIYSTIGPDIVEATIAVRLQKRTKTPDAIIAATALAHRLILVSRNTSDFTGIVGLEIINPFSL